MKSNFKRIDLLFHLVAIPAFTMLSYIFLKDPQEDDWASGLIGVTESMIWILYLWQANRIMIVLVRRNLGDKLSFIGRFLLQLFLALLIGGSMIVGSAFFHSLLVEPHKTFLECLEWSQRITLTVLVYSLLENAIYEAFFLFVGLSESQVEAERYRKESLEAQFQNLKNQLNPHFLFNSFNTLATIIEENTEVAVEFVHELSNTYRYVLASQKKDWVQLSEELDMIRSYVFLLQKRHEKGLQVDIDIAEGLTTWWLPPLSLQMLIENALKHNEASASRPLHISVSARDGKLVVDNNKQLRKVLPTSNGIGLSNIRSRYRFLADRDVQVTDTKDRFTVEVPLLQMVQK